MISTQVSVLIAQVSGISQSTDNSLRRKSDSAPPSICGCSPAEGFDKILQMTPNSLVSLFHQSVILKLNPRPSLSWPWKGNEYCMSEQWLSKKSPFPIPDHGLFFVERPLVIEVSRLMGSINRHILNNKVVRLLLSSYRFFDCNCNRVVCNQRRPAKTLFTLITISSLRSLLHSSFPLAMRCIALIFYSKDRTPLYKSKKNSV